MEAAWQLNVWEENRGENKRSSQMIIVFLRTVVQPFSSTRSLLRAFRKSRTRLHKQQHYGFPFILQTHRVLLSSL